MFLPKTALPLVNRDLFSQDTSALSTNSLPTVQGLRARAGRWGQSAQGAPPTQSAVSTLWSPVYAVSVLFHHCLSLYAPSQFGVSSIFKIPPSIQGSCYIPTTSQSLSRLFRHILASIICFFSNSESVLLFWLPLTDAELREGGNHFVVVLCPTMKPGTRLCA